MRQIFLVGALPLFSKNIISKGGPSLFWGQWRQRVGGTEGFFQVFFPAVLTKKPTIEHTAGDDCQQHKTLVCYKVIISRKRSDESVGSVPKMVGLWPFSRSAKMLKYSAWLKSVQNVQRQILVSNK